jgi:hypothetical protein
MLVEGFLASNTAQMAKVAEVVLGGETRHPGYVALVKGLDYGVALALTLVIHGLLQFLNYDYSTIITSLVPDLQLLNLEVLLDIEVVV